MSVGAIIGIVAASCLIVIFILQGLRMKGYLGGKDLEDPGNDKMTVFSPFIKGICI